MDARKPKRPRYKVSSSIPNPKRPRHEISSSLQIQNPNPLPTPSSSKQSRFGSIIISSLLSFPDSSRSQSSIDRVLEKALESASDDVSVQNSHINHILKVASLINRSAERCYRKRASIHNSSSWSLPLEITIKVFSKLDTKSLMQAMACCTMLRKCAMDPLCYSHINLTTSAKTVDNNVVGTMIHRAGKELRFLELGHVQEGSTDHVEEKSTNPLLTAPCLDPLAGYIGEFVRSLHLYDIRGLTNKDSVKGLVACSNITDLKIVGLYSPSDHLLKSLTTNCRSIEQLFLETYNFPKSGKKELAALVEFLTNIPNLTSLTLKGFKLRDATAQNLIEGNRKLTYLNISRNPPMKGRFLRDEGHKFHDSLLETLILRECALEEKEVVQFLNSLSKGNFRFINHIDISNSMGLMSEGGKKTHKLNFPLERLKEEGINVEVVADFTKIPKARGGK